MIFALDEEGTLTVLADIDEARTQFESYDVEARSVVFFDESGRPLEPSFPKRSNSRFLGVQVDSDPGPFELRQDKGRDNPSLGSLLSGKVTLASNRWFASLAELLVHVAGRNA